MDYSFTDAEVDARVPASQANPAEAETGHRPPIAALVIIQGILFLAHWLIFHTVTSLWAVPAGVARAMGVALMVLSVSFTVTTLLSMRFSNWAVAKLYTLASIWLGILNFLFWAACLFALVNGAIHLAGAVAYGTALMWVGRGLFAAASAAIVFGFINARVLRVRRVQIELPNLPESWRGRKALLITDLHLGNILGAGFARRVARLARRLDPAIVFIAGDLFDGSKADPEKLAAPLFEMAPPLGVYFSEGNHEGFGDAAAYKAVLRSGGFHVLESQAVEVDGVQVVGVSYGDSTYPLRLRTFLDGLGLGPEKPSILLNHVPNRLPIVEHTGVSLQLSGHTHLGQIYPFTWITRRAFGKYTYGLQRFGSLQVLTSSGVGTWGPPMRVGSSAEVVLITFS